MSKKRPREAQAVDTQLTEIYEDLANDNEEIRLKATHALLVKLSPESGLTEEQLKEVLRRLIRGLCSGRKGARLGFSIALTELQSRLFGANASRAPPMSIAEFIQSLKKETEILENISGQEKRDHYFGRLFGAETVIKSGILLGAHVNLDLWSQIVDLIVELAKRKSWLREECGWVLYQAIQGSRAGDLSSEYVQTVVDKINENGLMETPEGVAIWIATLENHSAVKFPSGLWKHKNPLHRKEKARLAKIMREAPLANHDECGQGSKTSQKGMWSSKLHFAWQVILHQLLKNPSDGKSMKRSKDELNFRDFWDECVDRSLFADSASNERKYWGFLLFQHMFQQASQFPAEVLFSPNLMRCLMNQLSSTGRYLHLAAEKAVKVLLRRVKYDTTMAVPSLSGLMKPPNGEVNFDQITKTKTVEKIVTMVTDDCLGDFLQFLHGLVMSPGVQDEKSAASRRRIIGDLLLSTARSRSVVSLSKFIPLEAEKSVQQILSLLVELAYFAPNKQSNPPISSASHDMFKAKISSCLTDLTSKSDDPSTFAYHVVCAIKSQLELNNSVTPLLVMDEVVAELIGKSWKLLGTIHSKLLSSSSRNRPLLFAFKLLCSLVILQVYNGDVDAVNMLDELEGSFYKLQVDKTSRTPGGPEVVVEIILSLVAKPALLFRRIGPHVFSACAPYLNETALQFMIQVLITKENITGQEEVFDHDEEIEGGTSDIEQLDANGFAEDDSTTNNDDSIASDTNEGSDTSSKIDEDNEELAAFDAKLAEALETGSFRKDRELASDDEPSEADMDDDQMQALDEQLAKIFRERKIASSKKSQKKDAKEALINFKCRVLELLEVFIKEQHTNPLGLKLLIPFLTTIRVTKSNLVSKKACDLVREYTRLCKGKKVPNVEDPDTIFDLLAMIHAEAMREGSHAYASACSQASLLVVKVLVARDREYLRRVVLRYAATQERYMFDPKCKVKPAFFSDWLNWCNSARK